MENVCLLSSLENTFGRVRKLGAVMCLVPETLLPSTMNPRGPKTLLNVLMKGVGAWAWCQTAWIQISALSLSAYWQDTQFSVPTENRWGAMSLNERESLRTQKKSSVKVSCYYF